MTLGLKNVMQEPLVDRAKVLLPLLHIKPVIVIQFVRLWTGNCFRYMWQMFCTMTHNKLKAGIVTVFQIHKLLTDSLFENSVNPLD